MDSYQITPSKLNGNNYLQWSKLVKVYLTGQGLQNHLFNNSPNTDDKNKIDEWTQIDAQIWSMLWTSMEPEIADTCTHLDTCKEVWDYVRSLYSPSNLTRMHDVSEKYFNLQKGDKSITDYFCSFKEICNEMRQVFPMIPNVQEMQKRKEYLHVMKFLAGLPPEFECIKCQILSEGELPSLAETYSRVWRSSCRDKCSHGNSSQDGVVDSYVPVSHTVQRGGGDYDSTEFVGRFSNNCGGGGGQDDDWEHVEIFIGEDEAVDSDPGKREERALEVPAPPEFKEDEDEEGNKEEGGLNKSGKESEKLLGKAAGTKQSDANDSKDEVNQEDEITISPVLALEKPKEEPAEPSPAKQWSRLRVPHLPPTRLKRNLTGDDVKVATAVPLEKGVQEVKSPVKMEYESAMKSNTPSPSEPSATSPTEAITDQEIRAFILQNSPLTTLGLITKFKARLKTAEEKKAFTGIVRRNVMIQNRNGPYYLVLRDK